MSKEGEPIPVLVHIVGINKDSRPEGHKGPKTLFPRPDIRGRLLQAAVRELGKKEPHSFVFSGRPFSGDESNKPISTVYADEFNRRTYNKYPVYTNPEAVVTTAEELKTLKRQMEKDRSKKAVCLGWSVHVPRIKLLVERMFGKNKDNITVLSPEEVLGKLPNERNRARYLRIIDGLKDTPEEKNWESYEKKQLWILKHILFAPSLFNFVARYYRPKAQ